MLKFISVLSLLFLLSSCAAQKTVFLSDPSGALVTVNGEVVGKTPCEYEYRAGSGKIFEVVVHKDQYQEIEGQFVADAVDKESRHKWMVAGLVWSPLWLGTLFTKKLQDSYHFVLTRLLPENKNDADEATPLPSLSLQKDTHDPSGIERKSS